MISNTIFDLYVFKVVEFKFSAMNRMKESPEESQKLSSHSRHNMAKRHSEFAFYDPSRGCEEKFFLRFFFYPLAGQTNTRIRKKSEMVSAGISRFDIRTDSL